MPHALRLARRGSQFHIGVPILGSSGPTPSVNADNCDPVLLGASNFSHLGGDARLAHTMPLIDSQFAHQYSHHLCN